MRLYAIPHSTNVERVALALAHKGLEAETVLVDPADRSEVRRVSGQELVPVLTDDGAVVHDSMGIVRYLEERYPSRPLYPAEPPRRAELLVFIDWFNRVWKRPPNAIADELRKPAPSRRLIEELGASMAAALDLFVAMLDGRAYLFGDAFSAADCAAFPFLKYAILPPASGDPDVFHVVLHEHQRLGPRHRRLEAWIRRIDERPRSLQG